MVAITVTTVALAIGLYFQFRLAFWLAVIAALSIYIGLLALHALVRRSERVETLSAEVRRLEAELSRSQAGAAAAPAPPGSRAPASHLKGPRLGDDRRSGVDRRSGGDRRAVPRTAVDAAPGPATQAGAALQSASVMPSGADTDIAAPPRPSLETPSFQPTLQQAHEDPTTASMQTPPRASPQLASPTQGFPQGQGFSKGQGIPQGWPQKNQLPDPSPAATRAARQNSETAAQADVTPPPFASMAAMPPPLPTAAYQGAAPADASPPSPRTGAPPNHAQTSAPDYWSYRPLHPSEPQPASGAIVGVGAGGHDAESRAASPPVDARPRVPARTDTRTDIGLDAAERGQDGELVAQDAPGGPRQADLEMIQGLIKKLADEVNAAEAGLLKRPQGASRVPPAAIDTSVNALRTAADTMRRPDPDAVPPALPALPETRAPAPAGVQAHEFHTTGPQTTGPQTTGPQMKVAEAQAYASRPTAAPAAHARLAAITEAITAGRLDVLLEPILGLADQRPRHYEVTVRLRDKAGEVLDPPDSVPELRESGLLPLLDCARITRTAQVAERLADRGKAGAVFSGLSGESLSHDQFLSDFTDAYASREALAAQLVLSFPQGDVRIFSPRDWETLREMNGLGFRFALQSVTDLDMDFEALKAAGFDFVKLDAAVFLDGMPASGGPVPADDICRHLSQLGMTLIVGAIATDAELARIFGFGVLFGQGQLFGGPRALKPEAISPPSGSHAAA